MSASFTSFAVDGATQFKTGDADDKASQPTKRTA
jgi:hypothetical protein